METFQARVSIKVSSGISDFRFASIQYGIFWHGPVAHVLSLRSMFPTFFASTSPAISLERICPEIVLVRFEVYLLVCVVPMLCHLNG